MRLRLMLALTLFATVVCGCAVSSFKRPVEAAGAKGEYTILPTRFGPGRILVQVSINGSANVWMSLDTGSTDSWIDARYAQQLRLPGKQADYQLGEFGHDALTDLHMQTVDAEEVHVGAVKVRMQFGTSDFRSNQKPATQDDVVGTLGLRLFAAMKYPLEVDYRQKIVRLWRSSDVIELSEGEKKYEVPMEANLIATIPVTINGVAIEAFIDTGSNAEVLMSARQAKAVNLAIDGPDLESFIGRSGATNFNGKAVNNVVVKIGNLSFPPHRAAIVDMWKEMPVNLGDAVFQGSRIVLDFSRRTFTVIK